MKTFYLSKNTKSHVNEYEVEGEHYSDLISYTTRVAHYNHTTREISVYGWFSATTARHINEFITYYGFQAMSKAEMMNDQEKEKAKKN